jgi:hypothetical protein
MDRGLYLTSTGKTVPFYSMGNDTGAAETNSVSQITINTEARDVLKDLFPNIPDNDLNQIIKTAFQKVCVPPCNKHSKHLIEEPGST